MSLTVVPELPADDNASGSSSSLIDQIVREGARKMLAAALQAEVDAYIVAFAGERDEAGRRLVVRNGYHQPREILTAAGAIPAVSRRPLLTPSGPAGRRDDPQRPERVAVAAALTALTRKATGRCVRYGGRPLPRTPTGPRSGDR
ncbi:hypothetical protein GCM10018965_058750 [Nonomuraea roseola]